MASVTIMASVTYGKCNLWQVLLMASVIYGKCYLWKMYYGKCNYYKSIYGKSIMVNETKPKFVIEL